MPPFPVFSQAAHYGCGCWAENACNMNPYSTAVSTSGIPQHNLFSLFLFITCSALFFETTEIRTWYFYVSRLFCFVESSFKKPDNTFRWPPTFPAEWFSSVTSSAYWVVILHSLLVSWMPGALLSPLDLQWHLWYDGRSMARNESVNMVNLLLLTLLV